MAKKWCRLSFSRSQLATQISILAFRREKHIMAKTYYPTNDAEFAIWLANFSNKSTANKSALGITGDQLTALETGLAEFNSDLALKQQKKEESTSQTSKVRSSRKKLNKLVGKLNTAFKSKEEVSGELLEELGLDSKDSNLNASTAGTPSDLVVTGTSDGINHLKWNRGNNKQGTMFIIEAKIGDSPGFVIVDAVTSSFYEHTNQAPGVKTQYRIKAKRGEIISGYSNVGVVYG
jgi:hypothetical protein